MLRLSTLRSSEGYSLVELLIGVALAMAVTATALTLALSSRRMYDADQVRVRLNDSLRSGRSFLIADIRQAGERLGNDIFAIEIHDGSSGGPDELIVRRNLSDVVHSVCENLVAGPVRWMTVSLASGSGNCAMPPTRDDLDTWHDYRVGQGETVPAFIYNPVSGQGEFFDYELDRREESFGEQIAARSGTRLTYDYPVVQRSRIYLLEQRRYRLEGDTLQLMLDGRDSDPVNLIHGIRDFQVQAVLRDGTLKPTLDPAVGDVWFNVWKQLRSIEVDLRARSSYRQSRTLDRNWSSQVLPRNVLSR